MKKLIVINDKSLDSVTFKVAKKFFLFEGSFLLNGETTVKLLKEENPDLVFLDMIEEDKKDTDIINLLCSLDPVKRLRVSVFRLSTVKAFLFRILPVDVIDHFVEGMLGGKIIN
ncbi:MAG: hypothetical protein Kow0098_06150 [Ignavibacteriaceae bacterium]